MVALPVSAITGLLVFGLHSAALSRYTWFSLEALDESWQNLQKLSRVSSVKLVFIVIKTCQFKILVIWFST